MGFNVPVLFIVFNRPDTTEKVFQRIREIRPKRLFVAADGPRAAREGEKEKCEAVRKIILEGVDWECDLQLKFSDSNLGCGKAESGAMLWFFKAVGEGIVLEDDTLPDLSFFGFCKELLAYYRNDDTIKMIGGNNLQKGKIRGDGSYYFSSYTHSWGFASWWRAWQDYDLNLDSINDSTFEKLLNEQFNNKDEKDHWRIVYKNLRAGKYDTWDFQFLFTMWLKKGKCIIPNSNLVTNIGFGNNATHTIFADDPLANLPLGSMTSLGHPANRKVSNGADRLVYKSYFKTGKGWIKKIKRFIGSNK